MVDCVSDIDTILTYTKSTDIINDCIVKKGLLIWHLNIRSLRKNWEELLIVLQDVIGTFDVLALTEISVNVVDDAYCLPGYNAFSKTRSVRKGGGILLFVRNDIKFNFVNINFNNFEGLLGKLIVNGNALSLLVVYRPPEGCRKSFVLEVEEFITQQHKNDSLLLVGDVNINLFNDDDYRVQEYENMMSENGFRRCIYGATREEISGGRESSTCIDHVYARIRDCQVESVIYLIKISDHYMIGVDVHKEKFKDLKKNTDKETKNKICEHTLKQAFKGVEWNELLRFNECNDLYDNIVKTFSTCYEKASFTKISEKKIVFRKDWMSLELLKAIQERDKLFQRWKNCKSIVRAIYMADYKKSRNLVCAKIKKAKIKFYSNEIEKAKHSMKETWEILNKLSGKCKKKGVDETISKYLGKTNSNEVIVNTFAESFVTEIVKIQHNCSITTQHGNMMNPAMQSMFMPIVHSAEVEEMIEKMNVNKQPGLDGIRVKDMQYLNKEIGVVIAHLINLSIKSGIVPDNLKTSIVRPIYKKGDHLLYTNYRPISLLPVIEKILERVIVVRLTNYLEEFGIISKYQYGFQKGKGTNDLLNTFSDFVNTNLNNNFHVVALFIDFSKAFDTINHKILLNSLQNIGIAGPLLVWFENYLRNRRIIVKVSNTYSFPKDIVTGVPQGSNLGPILYIIYVNHVFRLLHESNIFMYADDTVLLAAHRDIECAIEELQINFNRLLQWTHDNALVINSDKTKIIHICSPFNVQKYATINVIFHSHNCLHTLRSDTCNSCIVHIEVVDSIVYLGVTIDRHFTWKPHINLLCNRLRACNYLLYNINYILPINLRKLMYSALVESLLSYGLLAWGNASMGHLYKLFAIQKRILKTIAPPNIKYGLNVGNDLFKALGFLRIYELFEYKLILMYYFSSDYKFKYDSVKDTRAKTGGMYKLPSHKNKHGKRRLGYTVPEVFNRIPPDLKDFNKYAHVKIGIKMWLLNENGND